MEGEEEEEEEEEEEDLSRHVLSPHNVVVVHSTVEPAQVVIWHFSFLLLRTFSFWQLCGLGTI